ncbi:MAG: PilX N-terminal domain-containing pilus assembly protein [Granulosicoccus sp.]
MHQAVLKQPPNNQRGAALVVALVLVLVSTLLGVSAMQSSDIEAQMANNTRFQQTAFRVAEAASDSLLTLPNIVTLVNDPTDTVETTSSIEANAYVTAEFVLAGSGPATGFSLGGQNGFRSLNFIASSTASIDAVDSKSGVVQGVNRLTPSRGD